MFNYNKLEKVLLQHKSLSDNHTQELLDFWERVSRVAMLCWADNTKEAIEEGLNSVGFKEIDALMESVWSMRTMEDYCDDEDENNNYYTPFGENILMKELIHILISLKSSLSPVKIF